MSIGVDTPASWWGDFRFDNGQSRQWRIGPLTLIVRCLGGEWQVASQRTDDFIDSDISCEISDTGQLPESLPDNSRYFQAFGESSLEIQFSVWAKRENFLELKNSIHEEIKESFDSNGIEIPFPHRTIYSGSATNPFPIKTVESKQAE